MAKFKAGDRVRVLPGHDMKSFGVADGDTGTVDENGSEVPYVVLDGERGNWKTVAFCERDLELVASATSAIRTVTRREIVPGVYGIVGIADNGDIRLVSSRDPEELRAAAKLFNELADVLDEQQKEAA